MSVPFVDTMAKDLRQNVKNDQTGLRFNPILFADFSSYVPHIKQIIQPIGLKQWAVLARAGPRRFNSEICG